LLGGVPRQLFQFVPQGAEMTKFAIVSAFDSYGNPGELLRQLKSLNPQKISKDEDAFVHQWFHMAPVAVPGGHPWRHRRIVPASNFVLDTAYEAFASRSRSDLVNFLCTVDASDAQSLRGWLFEREAHHVLAGGHVVAGVPQGFRIRPVSRKG
jgi:hypothetical protein